MTHEPLGPGRVTPPAEAASAAAPPAHSRCAVRLGPVAVLIVVLLAVMAVCCRSSFPAHCSSAMPAASPPRWSLRRAMWHWRSAASPGLAIDRAGVALVGASLMVASGALPPDEAYNK